MNHSLATLSCFLHVRDHRYESAPEFRRLVILDGISCVLNAHGASCLGNSIETCLDILLRGVDSADPSVVQKATENLLVCNTLHQVRTMTTVK